MRMKIFLITCASVCVFGLPLALADTGHLSNSQTDPHEGYSQAELPKGIIGVALQVSAHRVGDPAVLYVRAIHPEGPAAKVGLAHGDEILTVNDKSLAGKTYQEVVAMIRGEVGKSVKLKIKGERGIQEISIIRISEETLMEEKHL
ncbi:PDZ domain-containing protein [Candidatus Nitrospira salsa]